MLFCSQMILAGALITGAPCLASGDNGETSVFGSSDTNAEDEVSDLSGEGQIHKPASLNAPDFTSDPNFVDDSTDNTYGYYTIMGTTTVSLAQMTSQYNAHGSEYPSASLKEGGAETIDDFCTIILEEANAEGVRGEVVFEQAMLETGWLQYGGDSGISQYNFAGRKPEVQYSERQTECRRLHRSPEGHGHRRGWSLRKPESSFCRCLSLRLLLQTSRRRSVLRYPPGWRLPAARNNAVLLHRKSRSR